MDVASSRSAVILRAVGKAGRIILGRSVDSWGVSREAHTKTGFETPLAYLKHGLRVILDIWSLLKILLQSVERVTRRMSYSGTHWLNVFLISETAGGGWDFFNRNKLIPQRRDLLIALIIMGSSCNSQRCGEESEVPPGDGGTLTSPCALNRLCANAIGPAAVILCAGRKNTKKTNKPNQPP